jgi:NAD(P)-dependent dehydrogenase (short-subunit alcohol dehydrogenase family)
MHLVDTGQRGRPGPMERHFRFGRPDAAVLNAGIGGGGPLEAAGVVDRFDRIIAVDLSGGGRRTERERRRLDPAGRARSSRT